MGGLGGVPGSPLGAGGSLKGTGVGDVGWWVLAPVGSTQRGEWTWEGGVVRLWAQGGQGPGIPGEWVLPKGTAAHLQLALRGGPRGAVPIRVLWHPPRCPVPLPEPLPWFGRQSTLSACPSVAVCACPSPLCPRARH